MDGCNKAFPDPNSRICHDLGKNQIMIPCANHERKINYFKKDDDDDNDDDDDDNNGDLRSDRSRKINNRKSN
jgi:hypothetical protein